MQSMLLYIFFSPVEMNADNSACAFLKLVIRAIIPFRGKPLPPSDSIHYRSGCFSEDLLIFRRSRHAPFHCHKILW